MGNELLQHHIGCNHFSNTLIEDGHVLFPFDSLLTFMLLSEKVAFIICMCKSEIMSTKKIFVEVI